MISFFKKYISENDGATAIEYGLIGSAIALAIVATVFIIGGDVDSTFNTILTEIQ